LLGVLKRLKDIRSFHAYITQDKSRSRGW